MTTGRGKILTTLCISGLLFFQGFSQSNMVSGEQAWGDINTISTAVPFLSIAPDSRGGAIGDAGVATSPDASSLHWNPAKYAFIEGNMGVAISYTPWLRALINDINLGYLSGYSRMDENQVFALSLLYFSLGDITFTDIVGNTIGQFNPHEFAISGAYSRLLTDNLSGGMSLRYIYSNLTGGQYVGNTESHPGNSLAADVSLYWRKKGISIYERDSELAFGLNISNIGAKISYTENSEKDYIPTNLRFGGALTMDIDKYNSLCFTADINKLLVPTPPRYYTDSTDSDGKRVIEYGKKSEVSVPVGMVQSFYDAPGGFKEELREYAYSLGMEYWYAGQFALRGGYFHEHETKGNREFFTFGVGLKLNIFGLDFGYLIPTKGGNNNPLANTLRFTLLFDFDNLSEKAKE